MLKVYIYGLKCPEKGIVRYVGKSKNPKQRYSEHLSHTKARRYDNIHCYRWMAKLLKNNLKPELIILEECNIENWKEREKHWIAKFGLSNLLNMNEGGIEPPDNTGFKWTEEQKKNHPAHLRKGKSQWINTPHPLLGKEHPAKGQKRSKEFCELMRKQKLENMSYLISKKTGLDKDYYGYETEYHIDFTFQKQKCNVTIEVYDDKPSKPRLSSNTDGYHWLQFLLCQEPNCSKILELNFKEEVSRCQKAFGEKNIGYEQEDKETAWLTYDGVIDEAFVKLVAEVIEPRFANREQFFPE